MADPRIIVVAILVIGFIFFNPDTNLQTTVRDEQARLEQALDQAQRLLAVIANSSYDDFDTNGFSHAVKTEGFNLTAFRAAEQFDWQALPRVKQRVQDHLHYAIGEQSISFLEGSQGGVLSSSLYPNITGFAHGRWIRSKIEQNVGTHVLNRSALGLPGFSRDRVPQASERNFTRDAGDIRIELKETQPAVDLASYSRLVGNITHVSMDLTLAEDGTEQEEEMLLRGFSFPLAGLSVLTTTSVKFAGVLTAPWFALSPATFELSKTLLNESMSKSISKPDERALSVITPWAMDTQYLQHQAHAASPPKCEIIVYLQQLPPIDYLPSARSLQFFDKELRFPTGVSVSAAPDMRFSMLLFSPDCGFVLESEGPPDYAPGPNNHIVGPKTEVLRNRVREHMLLYGLIVLLQLVSLLRQMRDASTPSTRSRISFYTIASMVFGDALATVIFITIGLFVESNWTTILSTAFFSLVSMLLFGMRFLNDIWTVHVPELQRQEREELEEQRRRREIALVSARDRAQASYTIGTSSSDNTATTATTAPASLPPPSLPPPVVAAASPIDLGSVTVFMPSDQAGLQTMHLPNNNAEPESRVPTFGSVYMRFSFLLLVTLFLSISASTYPGTIRRLYFTSLAFAYLSFWVPQINRNIQRNCRRALKWEYVLSQSALRLLPVAYFFGWRGNILFARPHLTSLALMLAWIWMQVVLLASQEIVGPRWFVKEQWVPPAWDYHPILRSDLEGSTLPLGLAETASLPSSPIRERRNSISSNAHKASVARESKQKGKRVFDCAICVQDLEVPVIEAGEAGDSSAAVSGLLILARRTYMVTPCRHIFHSDCLEGWMKYRLQCPICREELPPL